MELVDLNFGKGNQSFLHAYNVSSKRCFKLGDLEVIEMH